MICPECGIDHHAAVAADGGADAAELVEAQEDGATERAEVHAAADLAGQETAQAAETERERIRQEAETERERIRQEGQTERVEVDAAAQEHAADRIADAITDVTDDEQENDVQTDTTDDAAADADAAAAEEPVEVTPPQPDDGADDQGANRPAPARRRRGGLSRGRGR